MLRQDEPLGARGPIHGCSRASESSQGGCVTAVAEESPYSGPNRSNRSQPARRQVAVAIEGHPGAKAAPRVVASGRGALAEQILQIAFDRGIKVRNDADLAEILATIEVESEIPLEALAAVAEILSYVYRAQSKLTAAEVTAAEVTSAKVTSAKATWESGT